MRVDVGAEQVALPGGRPQKAAARRQCEPEQASDAYESLRQGRRITDMTPDTICDGLRASLGTLTFGILSRHCDGVLLAGEAQIVAAMRLLWERLKQVVEPSGAVALATILRHPERFRGRRVGVILSGGNVDLDALPWTA